MEMASETSSTSSVASLIITGVECRAPESWTIVGQVAADDTYFSARVMREPQNGQDGVVCNNTFFSVHVRIFDNLSEASPMETALMQRGNGQEYTDEDGDYDYMASEMPELLWQVIYGQLFAPVQRDMDLDQNVMNVSTYAAGTGGYAA